MAKITATITRHPRQADDSTLLASAPSISGQQTQITMSHLLCHVVCLSASVHLNSSSTSATPVLLNEYVSMPFDGISSGQRACRFWTHQLLLPCAVQG